MLLLIVASLGAWIQSFRVFERAPRAQNIAQQVVSVVNVTRAALLYSDPFVRRDLLAELAANEGIRIYPLEPTDTVAPVTGAPLIQMAAKHIVDRLGPGTQVASEVNGIRGLWVSLALDDDRYWVFIDRDPSARTYGTQWIGWAAVALLLSLIGAVLITRLINRPLAQLSRAAAELGSGRQPAPLPETGPVEIRTVNESFNRMVADLGKLEADRAVLLAGISHDLRTPLTRLRLEVEMANVPQERARRDGRRHRTDRQHRAPVPRLRAQGAAGAGRGHRTRAAARSGRAARAHRGAAAVARRPAPGARGEGARVPDRTRSRSRQPADECSALRTGSEVGRAQRRREPAARRRHGDRRHRRQRTRRAHRTRSSA